MKLILTFVMISCVYVNCDDKPRNSSQPVISDNKTQNISNVTKVFEFVSGMGRAIQQLLSVNGFNIMPTNILPIKKTADDRSSNSSNSTENYKIEGEKLRADISKRVNQLQKVLLTAGEVLTDRGDVIAKRILEQANKRLETAKERADQILSEPESTEMAVKTLKAINNGISQLTTFIQHVLSRVNISINVNMKDNV